MSRLYFVAVESRHLPEDEGCKVMPLNDDQLRAIGRIAVQAAELEYSLHSLVCALVNPSNINIGALTFAKDQFSSMQERALRLSDEVSRDNHELGERIRRWADEAKKLQERRNEILHAIWVMISRLAQWLPCVLLADTLHRQKRL